MCDECLTFDGQGRISKAGGRINFVDDHRHAGDAGRDIAGEMTRSTDSTGTPSYLGFPVDDKLLSFIINSFGAPLGAFYDIHTT